MRFSVKNFFSFFICEEEGDLGSIGSVSILLHLIDWNDR